MSPDPSHDRLPLRSHGDTTAGPGGGGGGALG